MPAIELGFDPNLLQIGSVTISWHGVLTAIGVIGAVQYVLWMAAKRGLNVEDVMTVATWGIVGGVIGARLFFVIDHASYFAEHPLESLYIWQGGIAVYGSFIGGIVTGGLAARSIGIKAGPILDLAGPAMLIGQIAGRLGCLSNGDAWGAPCGGSTFPCVIYTHPSALIPEVLKGVPTHPYPVYEIVAELALLGIIYLLRDRFTRTGQTFLFAAIGYAIIRFSLTYFRQETIIAFGLQQAQLVAIATGVIALILFVRRSTAAAPVS